MAPLQFTVSSYCHGGGCVAVAALPDGGVAVRDEKARSGLVLEFTAAEWRAFIAAVRDGEFDLNGADLGSRARPAGEPFSRAAE